MLLSENIPWLTSMVSNIREVGGQTTTTFQQPNISHVARGSTNAIHTVLMTRMDSIIFYLLFLHARKFARSLNY